MKKIIIVGLGKSNKSLIKFLIKNRKNTLLVVEQDYKLLKKIIQLDENIASINDESQIQWKEISFVITSPSVDFDHFILKKARKNNIKVIVDIELFYLLNRNNNKFIGVTGTNGKSTVCSLIHHILQSNNFNSRLGGNIGIPVFDLMSNSNQKEHFILELSSFQLQFIRNTRLNIASLINITPDHLDHHCSMKDYIDSKEKIFCNQKKVDYAVINIDCKYGNKIYSRLKTKNTSKTLPISTKHELHNGIYAKNNKICNGITGNEFQISTIDYHNMYNLLVVFANCFLLGVKEDNIVNTINSFKSLKHRIELVRRIDDISFINDSKSTNIEATLNAINQLDNVYLILGGKDKGGNLNLLNNCLRKIRCIFLIGSSTEKFFNLLSIKKVKIKKCYNMKDALNEAFILAKIEKEKLYKNILLSPGCSSFDQWKNFEHRGNCFSNLVKNLK